MHFIDLIDKKKRGLPLSKEDYHFFIQCVTNGSVPDYQVSALLMALFLNGLNKQETADLTLEMAASGQMPDLSSLGAVRVDKHSTGGVADTTTLIAVPLAAACGAVVTKMSGRGLGFTGGTVDKLESIPSYVPAMDLDRFIAVAQETGAVLAGQSSEMAPADKKLYALRDVTGTVESASLIAASIMSKKIASGCTALVLDVKWGKGAFMNRKREAIGLAKMMIDIGKRTGIQTTAFITSMNAPLGKAIGNSLEVIEAIEVLSNKTTGPLTELSLRLAAEMVRLSKPELSESEALRQVKNALSNGAGLKKLAQIVKAGGGNEAAILNPNLLPKSEQVVEIKATRSGTVLSIDALALGKCALLLGAGREKKEDSIDPGAGMILEISIGNRIHQGDILARFFCKSSVLKSEKFDEAKALFQNAVTIGKGIVSKEKLIEAVLR